MQVSPNRCCKWIHGIQILSPSDTTGASIRKHNTQALGSQIQVTPTKNKPHPVGAALWSHTESSSTFTLYRGTEPNSYILDIHCQGCGAFAYRDNEILVYWEPGGTGSEHYLHSFGLAFLLEQQNIPCLHANSLAIDGHGVGLMAKSQTGKSTLTAALLQHGHTLLADDMLPLRNINDQWPIFPGPASMRLWPDSGKQFTTAQAIENSPRVHEHFEKRILDIPTDHKDKSIPQQPKILSVVYMLDRTTENNKEPIQIQTLTPTEAMLALLENSLIGGAPRAMGVEALRLKQLAKLLTQVQVKRLRYPSGFQRLDEVCQLLKKDVSNIRCDHSGKAPTNTTKKGGLSRPNSSYFLRKN